TGQTAGEFIRIYRLNRAAELLKKQSATVAEIAYDVGFSSPSYFAECFRKQFGVLPSEI
ncbi:MAG: helix-turn-helix transcriptional regulator, partial [Chlorobi bacterium]|nr:helix-turn-helix transcriptional regulator [Chlorobiota bacterium]